MYSGACLECGEYECLEYEWFACVECVWFRGSGCCCCCSGVSSPWSKYMGMFGFEDKDGDTGNLGMLNEGVTNECQSRLGSLANN